MQFSSHLALSVVSEYGDFALACGVSNDALVALVKANDGLAEIDSLLDEEFFSLLVTAISGAALKAAGSQGWAWLRATVEVGYFGDKVLVLRVYTDARNSTALDVIQELQSDLTVIARLHAAIVEEAEARDIGYVDL